MSEHQPWTADRPLDAEAAARAIREAVPELADADVRLLGAGWDFDAYEANERWVFRFPRRESEQPRVHKDGLLLPWLADRVGVPVPRPAWDVLRAPSFPYVFLGYEKLHGRMAATLEPTPELRADLGRQLGRFLAGLHALDVPPSIVAGARLDDPLVDPGPLRDGMRKYLPGFCAKVPHMTERATRFFDDPEIVPPPYGGVARLIHADLHAEHLLLDPAIPEHIAGTIDWSDARISDPARDFACIYSWGGERMLHAMLECYDEADAMLEVRSRFLGICFSFMDWAWWVEVDNRVARAAVLETLDRALPERAPDPSRLS